MAAELIGTAYVRIKAVTAGLASEIQDGIEKGAKDAKTDKAGEAIGADLGEGASKSFKGSMAEGVTDALDAPAIHKGAQEGGAGIAKDVTDGVEKEHKRRNPFASMLDSFKRLNFKNAFKDVDMPSIDLPPLDIPGLEKEGEKAGDAVTRGVDKSHKKRNPFKFLADSISKISVPKPIEWLSIFGPATLSPIIGTILSMLALVVQGLGFIVLAAAGAGAALAGIAAVAVPGFAVLFAAFKTQTKALERFKKRAKELLKPWEDIGIATQEHLLPGLESFLANIQHLIPLFTEFGSNIGRTIGDFASMAGETLTSEKNMRALGVVLSNSEGFFANMSSAAGSFIDLLMPFLSAVAPLALQFSESLANWAAHLAEIVNTDFESENLADRFQGWYDKLSLVVGIVGDVLAGLWGILTIAGESPQAGGLFDSMATAAQTFRDWVSSTEGTNKIKKFFDDAQPVLDEISRLLGNVYNLIVAPTVEGDGGAVIFERLATALDLLNDVLENPITQTVVPYLLTLAVGLTLLSAVPDFVTGGLASALTGMGGALVNFTKGATGLGTATGMFGSLGTSFAPVAAALAPIAAALLAVAAALAIAGAVWYFWDDIVNGLEAAWEWFVKLETPMQVFVAALVALGAALVVIGLVALGPLGALIAGAVGLVVAIKNWSTIAKYLDIAWDAIYEFFINLPGLIGDAFGAIGDFLVDLPAKLGPLVDELVAIFATLPTTIKDALLEGLTALPGLILDGLAALGTLAQDLLGLIADGLIAAAPVLGEWFIKLPLMILDWVMTAVSDLVGIGLDIVMWIVNGLAEALPDIIAWFISLPFEILTVVRRGIADLISLGVEMIVAVVNGLIQERHRIFDWFVDLPGNILEGIAAAAEFLWDFGKGLITGMWNGIQEMWPTISSFFTELPGKILDFLDAAWDFLFDIGEDLMNGLWDGINSVWDSIDEFFGELPGEIGGFFKDLPGEVAGPLGDFVDSVIEFFTDLPGQILTAMVGIGTSLISGFASAFTALVSALPGAFRTVVTFFLSIPVRILQLFLTGLEAYLNIGWWLISHIFEGIMTGVQVLWDFFTGLPQAIIDLVILGAGLVISIGGSIIGWIVEGLTTLGTTLWDWFTGLPGAILDLLIAASGAILDIGGTLIDGIVEGITEGASALWDWVTGLPAAIWETLSGIISEIWDIGTNFIMEVLVGIGNAEQDLFNWFLDLPGVIWNTLTGIISEIWDIGTDFIGEVLVGIGNAEQDIFDWFLDLPGLIWDTLSGISSELVDIGVSILGWILDGLAGIGSAITTAITGAVKSGWNTAISYIPEVHLSFNPPGPGSFNLDWDPATALKWNTMGAIIPGSALGTVVGVGEGGRAEAIIPLTRPSRALALMQESGLDKLVLDAYMGGSVGNKAVAGETTMLHIENAVMTAPVDADMIVQKVVSAYNRLAS